MDSASPLNTYKLSLSYRGTDYQGWQVQPNGKTIQGELEKALGVLSKSKEVKTVGSGRTDSGVHAREQVVRVEMPLSIDHEALKKGLNSILPDDIWVRESRPCPEDFHPIHSAESKIYHYYFYQDEGLRTLVGQHMTFFPFTLDIAAMQNGAQLFEGSFDFQNYFCTGTPVKSTVRQIYSCHLERAMMNFPTSEVEGWVLKIEGNGFLKQMVRLIMGCLFEVGRGKVTGEQVKLSLQQKLEKKLGPVAAPEGLYLYSVKYP